MIIQIKYKDKQNWISINGTVTNWVNYSQKFKDERVQPYFVAPEEIINNWNGREHDVQHVRWDSYMVEFYIQESEIHDINRMKSCSDIQIIEYNKNEDGTIKSKQYDVDTSKSANLSISEPLRIADTSSYKITIIFRTNKTIINKANPILNTNLLKLATSETQLKSDNPFISGQNLISAMDSNRVVVENNGDIFVYELIGGLWYKIGNETQTDFAYNIAICGLDSNNIAIIGDGTLRKYSWNGSNFSLVGSELGSFGSLINPTITRLTDNSIAIYDTTVKNLECYSFDGSIWAQTGNSLAVPTTGDISFLSSHNFDNIVLWDNGTFSLRNYNWDGTNFTLDHTTVLPYTDIIIQAMSATALSLVDKTANKLYNYTTNGAVYTLIDSLSLPNENYNSITKLSETNIILANEDVFEEVIVSRISPYNQEENDALNDIAWLDSNRILLVANNANEPIKFYVYELEGGNWIEKYYYDTGITGKCKACRVYPNRFAAIFTPTNKLKTYQYLGGIISQVGNDYDTDSQVTPIISPITTYSIVLFADDDNELQYLTFNGTNWILDSNTLSISLADGYNHSITCKNDSTVLIWDGFNKKIITIGWNGSFTVLSNQNLSLSNYCHIAARNELTLAILDSDNKILNIYAISNTGVLTLERQANINISSIENSLFSCLEYLPNGRFVSNYFQEPNDCKIYEFELFDINRNQIKSITTGENNLYYTDFNVVESTDEIDPIKVDWFDGTKKIAKTINYENLEMLFYFNSADKLIFLRDLKKAPEIYINDVQLLDYASEINQIGDDYYSIKLKGLIEIKETDFDLAPNHTYYLATTNTIESVFYTDFEIEYISEDPIISTLDNGIGVLEPTRSITKQVKKATFFLNESDAFNLKKNFELGGIVYLNNELVMERRVVSPEKLAKNLYKVEINCLILTSENY